jgi:hypothetical protein
MHRTKIWLQGEDGHLLVEEPLESLVLKMNEAGEQNFPCIWVVDRDGDMLLMLNAIQMMRRSV